MIINSIPFLLFFSAVFTLYYLPVCKATSKYQNYVLFFSSYVFYGYADWKLIPLLLSSTIVFYLLGYWLKNEVKKENWNRVTFLSTLGVILGIGILFYFKYLNFFVDSFASLLTSLGFHVSWTELKIVLPIGVSFFTFKLISYIIEVSRDNIEVADDFIDFAVYISFFPTILSGPIDRPNHFLPQLAIKRCFDYETSVDGCRQILWGMFTKMCIADNIAPFTGEVWSNVSVHSGSCLLFALLLYPIQLYADFNGYSNMAIGVGKLLGLRVARNFNYPFFAHDISDFWRRWHISLTSWVTDYIFTPLNYSFRRYGIYGVMIAVMINLIVIGLWHGARWMYVLFGIYHGLLFIPIILSGSLSSKGKIKKNGFYQLPDSVSLIMTYFLVAYGMMIFNAEEFGQFMDYNLSIINNPFTPLISGSGLTFPSFILPLSFAAFMLIYEWFNQKREYPLHTPKIIENKPYLHVFFYAVFFILINLTANISSKQFIYFQF